MHFKIFDVWKRILENLGLLPPEFSKRFLKLTPEQEVRLKPPEFDSSKQVRVLLFRELNGQERRLLFDSKAVRKRDPSASPSSKLEKPPTHLRNKESSIEKSFKLNDGKSREFVYEWQKSSSDEQMLREMIFGSVSISYQGTTLKVHTIKSPLQVMISVVFPAPQVPMFRIGEQELEESGNWNSSVNEIRINKPSDKAETHLAHSVPVNVPSRLSGHFGESRDSDSDSLQSHDGYSSLPTTHLSPEMNTACLPRSSSYNSLQRRLLRNKATSIEMGLQKPDDAGITEEYSRSSGQKRVKLGLSIVVNLNEDDKQEERRFNDFLFTHMTLIEGHIMSLKDTVIKAYLNRRNFVHLMYEGSKKLQQTVCDLYTAPRLQNPEWLTIISSPNHRHLSYSFIEKFASLLKQYDKKETHFFVSTLLTAVLTHHLAWVPSVIPTESKIQSTETSHKYTPVWIDLLAKSRPYNPHWVQLGDLYGAIGFPLKLSKTVVKGQKREIILKFLQVLSYFIRCSDICEQLHEGAQIPSSDTHSINSRLSDKKPCCSEAGISDSKTDIKPDSNTLETCHAPCCAPKPSLPQELCLSKDSGSRSTATLGSNSDSSKDTCDITITPTEAEPSRSESSTVVPQISETDSTSLSSSLQSSSDKMTGSRSKRPALQEHQSNCKNTVPNASSLGIKCGKENNPSLNIMSCGSGCMARNCLCSTASCSQPCKTTSKSRQCCNCEKCPCSDNHLSTCSSLSKELTYHSPNKGKECESIEEGYHSMEEPHSPNHSNIHLSEMLKRLDSWCPEGLDERPLPEMQCDKENPNSMPYKSFGWSLMAGVSDHYLMDFCLQGLQGSVSEEEIRQDLLQSTKIHVLGEPVSEAVCIVADTDKWCINLLSSNFGSTEKKDSFGMRVTMSSLVSGICDAILNMHDLGIPQESCVIYLEDRLQELYFRSQILSDYLRCNRTAIPLNKVASTLNIDVSDIPLLLSVATTHTPYLSVYNR